MVMTVAGPPLTKFAGHGQPQHAMPRLERASNGSGERRDEAAAAYRSSRRARQRPAPPEGGVSIQIC